MLQVLRAINCIEPLCAINCTNDRSRRALAARSAKQPAAPTRLTPPPSLPEVHRFQPRPKISPLKRIGFLEIVSEELNRANMQAFQDGMAKLGYSRGKDYEIDYRSEEGVAQRLPVLVQGLIERHVDVIVTRGTPAALAAKAATSTIPIVMVASGGPLELGIVKSLSSPGGNVTGLSSDTTEIAPKRVEMARELIPNIASLALVNNSDNPVTRPQWDATKGAAESVGIKAVFLDLRREEDIRPMFDRALNAHIGVLLFANDAIIHLKRKKIVELAAETRLPAIYANRELVSTGGLMSYSANYADLYFRAPTFVDRIFKGVNPSVPVELPTQFDLVVNLKAAKALGLSIPPLLLAKANDVME